MSVYVNGRDFAVGSRGTLDVEQLFGEGKLLLDQWGAIKPLDKTGQTRVQLLPEGLYSLIDADSYDPWVHGPKLSTKGKAAPNSLSTVLSTFLGGITSLHRHKVMRRIWEYAMENGLVDQKDCTNIIFDDSLSRVFQCKSASLAAINEMLLSHINEPERSRVVDISVPHRRRPDEASNHNLTTLKQDFKEVLLIVKSPHLFEFCGLALIVEQSRLVRGVWSYIKRNGLYHPTNSHIIVFDDKLRRIFGASGTTISGLRAHIGHVTSSLDHSNLYVLSRPLAELCGGTQRTTEAEVVVKVWWYIRESRLLAVDRGYQVTLNTTLKRVLNSHKLSDSVSLFELRNLLMSGLNPLPKKPIAPRHNRQFSEHLSSNISHDSLSLEKSHQEERNISPNSSPLRLQDMTSRSPMSSESPKVSSNGRSESPFRRHGGGGSGSGGTGDGGSSSIQNVTLSSPSRLSRSLARRRYLEHMSDESDSDAEWERYKRLRDSMTISLKDDSGGARV